MVLGFWKINKNLKSKNCWSQLFENVKEPVVLMKEPITISWFSGWLFECVFWEPWLYTKIGSSIYFLGNLFFGITVVEKMTKFVPKLASPPILNVPKFGHLLRAHNILMPWISLAPELPWFWLFPDQF